MKEEELTIKTDGIDKALEGIKTKINGITKSITDSLSGIDLTKFLSGSGESSEQITILGQIIIAINSITNLMNSFAKVV